MTGVDVSWGEVAASLVLVALAVAVSLGRGARLEGDLALATARSFVQLIAVGYVIQAIFDSDSLLVVIGAAGGDGRRGHRHRAPARGRRAARHRCRCCWR